jgi:hypothetical protein
MPQLARRWSDLLLTDLEPGDRLTQAAQESGSLLRPGATEQEVLAAEERLGRRLPPSYREFLLVSNGAFGDLYGPSLRWGDEPEKPPYESEIVGVALLPVQDIRWLRDVNEWWANAELDSNGPGGPATKDGDEIWSWAPFANGIVIAVDQAPGTTCLVPFEGMDEWQVWNIHKETSQAFLSFRSFLEYMVAEREPVTTVEELRAVIEQAEAGNHFAIMRLSRTTTPDGVPLLADVIERNVGSPFRAAVGLGRIGTPKAIEELIRLRPPGVEKGLCRAVGPERCGDILVEWGAFWELWLIDDPRAAAVAAANIDELSNGDRETRRRAFLVIEQSRDANLIPALLPLLERDPDIALDAARVLAILGAPEGRRRIAELAVLEWVGQSRAQFFLTRLDASA